MMALLYALFVVLIPVELGYLLYEGKKKNGRFSLQGVVLYRTSIPVWQYFLWSLVLFVLMGLIFTLMKPVDAFLQQNSTAGFRSWRAACKRGIPREYSSRLT